MKIYTKIFKYLFPKTLELIDKKRAEFKSRKSIKWASINSTSIEKFMMQIDKSEAQNAINFKKKLELESNQILSKLKIWQGGGGAYHLLYFLIMKIKPLIVVETGVASGWSSNAILTAMHKLKIGKLYSSDLPYPNTEGSEEAIGILVNDNIRKNWTLCKNGDNRCLKKFKKVLNKIDIFHYDSDKSYQGRKEAFNLLKPLFSKNTIVIFDDVQNNFHFRDLVNELKVQYKIFEFQNKFVGIFVYGGKNINKFLQ